MVPAPSSGSMACVQQIRASIRRGSPAAHARLPRNPDALSPHSRRESNANPSRREAPGRLARARHNANASRKARAGRKGREDSGTAKTKREGNGETRRERQPLPPMHALYPLFTSKGKGTRPLREKWQKEYMGGGRKGRWKETGAHAAFGGAREPLSEAPPWQGSANALPIASKEPSQNPPRRNRGSFRQKNPRSAAPEKRPQLPWQEGPQNNVGWETAVQNDARWMGVRP